MQRVLPTRYIHFSITIAPNAGPAKLIQIVYPTGHSPDACLKKLHEVKGKNVSMMGLNKVTDFLLKICSANCGD